MSWQLVRGRPQLFEQAERLSIALHHDGIDLPLPRLLWEFAAASLPRVWLETSRGKRSLDVAIKARSFQVAMDDGSLCILGQLPWGRFPELEPLLQETAPNLYYLPRRGWLDGCWHDGPLIWIEGGQLRAYVMPGVDAVLSPALEKPTLEFAEFFRKTRAKSLKVSLGFALQERVKLDAEQLYSLTSHDVPGMQEAFVILALRLAFTKVPMFFSIDSKQLTAQWRRYLQNLNIHVFASTKQKAAAIPLNLSDLCQGFDQQAVAEFFRDITESIPFVPAKLLQTWLKDC